MPSTTLWLNEHDITIICSGWDFVRVDDGGDDGGEALCIVVVLFSIAGVLVLFYCDYAFLLSPNWYYYSHFVAELLSTVEGDEEPRYSQSVIQSFSPWNSLSSIRVTITTCPCKALYRFCINSTHSNWPSSSCVRMCRLSPVIQLYITHTHVVLSGFVLCPT